MIFDQNASGYGWVDYFHLLRSRWPIVLLVCSLVLLSGAAVHKRVPRLYQSALRIELEVAPGETGPGRSATAFTATQLNDLSRQVAELRSRSLLSEVVGTCGLVGRWQVDGESEALHLLEERIRVKELQADRALEVTALDLSPEFSAALANAVADCFLERKAAAVQSEASARVVRLAQDVRERHEAISKIEARLVEISDLPGGSGRESVDLRRQLVSERYLLRSLEAKHQLAGIKAGEAVAPAYVLDRAEVSEAKAAVSFWTTLPCLIVVGLISGGLVAIMMARGETRGNIIASLLNGLQLPVAGFAPLSGASLLSGRLVPPFLMESYRDLRTKLQRLPSGDCLLMTLLPLRDPEGLAEAATNLACVLADGGSTVLVIDADFRNPQLHQLFDAANHPGLSDFLSGEMRLEETVIKVRRPNLWFMPSGPLHDDPCGLITGRRMGDLIWDMRSRFDFILLISPAINEVSDAGALAALADCTAVVTPYRGSTLSQLRKARVAIESASAQLSAVFLTMKVPNVGSGVRSGAHQAGRLDPVALSGLRNGSK